MSDTRFVNATGTQSGTLVIASWLNDVNTNTYPTLAAVVGTNAITATGASTVTAGYSSGVAFRFIPQNTNTGAVTININSLGIRNITKYGGTALVAGDLLVGSWAFITYDGTQFQLLNPGAQAGRLISTRIIGATTVYTPTPGTNAIYVRAVGGGGGGGGAAATAAGTVACGGGGGSAGYVEGFFTSGFSGATATIGAGGTSGVGGAGGTGGNTSLGALFIANGGSGGQLGASGASAFGVGGNAGSASGGTIQLQYESGFSAIATFASGFVRAGAGGSGPFGGGGDGGIAHTTVATTANGSVGLGRGSGGGGSVSASGGGAGSVGGTGGAGLMIIQEYS